MSEPEVLTSAEQFYFDIPLYVTVGIEPGLNGMLPSVVQDIYGHGTKIDGYCHECQRQVTFSARRHLSESDLYPFEERHSLDSGLLTCDRNKSHKIYFHWLCHKGTIQKFGQLPSLATITNAELAQYRGLMSKPNAQEFYKAVGLAAHGVGIGSFVYLRRVFERLIQGRFDEFKTVKNWDGPAFNKLKMSEKVQHLKGHLPEFLVSNSRVYSILSIGIHQLDEQQCLAFFELMKDSIVVILEDDRKRIEELDRRRRLSRSINGIDFTAIDAADE